MKTSVLRRAKLIADRFAAPRFTVEAADDDVGELYIYDQIGGDWWSEGVTPKAVADALAQVKGVKTLNVFINSPGGNVFDGVAIYNEIRRFDANKVVHVDGIAASAASMIAMAGDEVVIAHNATMMIHEPWSIAIGNAAEMREAADLLDKISDASVLESYSRTGQTREQLKAWMAAETWMNATEAVERRFADRVIGPKKKSEGDDSAAARAAAGSPRDFERFLREAGLSRSQAKGLMARGFDGLRVLREAEDKAPDPDAEKFAKFLTELARA